MKGPRVLLFDIESAGVNALRADLGFVIVFGYMFLGDKRARSITLDKRALRKFDDKALLKRASKLFEQADLIVGHYASVFDVRFIQGRLLINGLPPIPPVKMRDTKFMASVNANFSSNRLKHLAKILKLPNKKLDNNWPIAWFKVMQGDMNTLRKLARYCEGDVMALRDLYLKLRPFDRTHTRIIDDRGACRVCGERVQYRGLAYVGINKYRRFQCTQCGHWDRERKAIR